MGRKYSKRKHKKEFKRKLNKYKKRKTSHKMALRKLGRALRPYVQPGPISMAKKRSGIRRYVDEVRGSELNAPQDKIYWKVVGVQGCYDHYTNVLTEEGQDGDLGASQNVQLDYHVYDQSTSYHFRNVSNHPAYLTVYECLLRNDYNVDSATNTYTDCPDYAMYLLNKGWVDLAAADEFKTSTADGTIGQYVAGADDMTSYMKTVSPYYSKAFVQAFKVLKQSRIKITPGDDFWYKVRLGAHTYKAAEWTRLGLERLEGKGGHTKVILVSLRGCLGKGTASSTKSGWMDSYVAYEKLTKARVCRMSSTDHAMAVSFTSDDLTAVTLEGASAHQMANEGE